MSKNHRPSGNDEAPGGEPLSGPPRWVKVSGIVAGVVLFIAIAVMLLSGGEHGPARHGLGATGLCQAPGIAHIETDIQGSCHRTIHA